MPKLLLHLRYEHNSCAPSSATGPDLSREGKLRLICLVRNRFVSPVLVRRGFLFIADCGSQDIPTCFGSTEALVRIQYPLLLCGVTGNILEFGSSESRFDPWQSNDIWWNYANGRRTDCGSVGAGSIPVFHPRPVSTTEVCRATDLVMRVRILHWLQRFRNCRKRVKNCCFRVKNNKKRIN